MGRDYRLSSYCILTDLDNESENICMIHGYTGAIDIIDKSIAIFLKANATFDKGAIPCSAATKEALERRGYITVKSREEETEYVKRLANALFKKSMLLRSGFTVVVSYDCNFRCPYCSRTA